MSTDCKSDSAESNDLLIQTAEQRRLRKVCQDIESQALDGGQQVVETALSEHFPGETPNDDDLLEMVYTEFAAREEAGVAPEPDEYYQRFPMLRDRLARLLEIHRVFDDDEPPPSEADTWMPTDTLTPSTETVAGSATLANGYEILEKLGTGAMGVVFRARQTALNRIVAVKMLRFSFVEPEQRTRLLRESLTAARLQHANIVQVHEVTNTSNGPMLSMEYVDGGTLADVIVHEKTIEPRHAAELTESLARATHFAHQRGVIHRDLKPANVLMTSDGVAKVSDFGLARVLETERANPTSLTQTGAIVGTPCYMSPEQATGDPGLITASTDVYSLGAILYELLVGTPPFTGPSLLDVLRDVREREAPSPAKKRTDIPADLSIICEKCLQKDPARRYASAEALAEDLRRFLNHEPITARPVSTLERVGKWCRRRPAVSALLAALLLVGAGGIAGVIWQWRQAEFQRGQAENALAVSTETRREQKQTLRTLESTAYFRTLAAANREYLLDNAQSALEVLAECDIDKRDWEWRYLSKLCRSEGLEIFLEDWPSEVCFSPDGRFLAIAVGKFGGGTPGRVSIHDAATGEHIRELPGIDSPVMNIAWHPDSDRLVAVCANWETNESTTLLMWDVGIGELLYTVAGRGKHHAAFNVDGTRVSVACFNGTVEVYDDATGQLVDTLTGHTDNVFAVDYSPNGKWLASGARDRTVRVCDATTGELLHVIPAMADVRVVRFSPDSQWLAFGGYSQRIDVVELRSGTPKLVSQIPTVGRVVDLCFTPDSQQVLFSDLGIVQMRHVRTGGQRDSYPGYHRATAVAVSPDGKRLAAGYLEKIVRISDVIRLDEPETVGVVRGRVIDIAVAPDRNRVAIAGGLAMSSRSISRKLVRIADLDGNQAIDLIDSDGHQDWLTKVCWQPSGQIVASGDKNGTVCLWESGGGHLLSRFAAHKTAITSLQFDPRNPTHLLSSAEDGTWKIIDSTRLSVANEDASSAGDIEPDEIAAGEFSEAARAVFTPDGQYLVLASKAGDLSIRETADYAEVAALSNVGQVNGLAIHPEGTSLALAIGDKFAVWDLAQLPFLPASPKVRVTAHTQDLTGIAFHPGGKRIATCATDMTGKLWDAESGQRAMLLANEFAFPTDVEFAQNGDTVLIGSERYVHMWTVEPVSGAYQTVLNERESLRALRWHLDESLIALTHRDWFAAQFHSDHAIPHAHVDVDNPDKSGLLYRRAILLNRSIVARAELGQAVSEACEQCAEFWEQYREVAEPSDRRRREAAVWHAAVLTRIGRTDEANAVLEETARLADLPEMDRGRWLNSLAWDLVTVPDPMGHRPAMAVSIMNRSIVDGLNRAERWNTLGVAKYRNGDWTSAINAMRVSLTLGNDQPAYDLFFLSMAHARLGESDAARDWFGKATDWMDRFAPLDQELQRIRNEAEAVLAEPLSPAASSN